MAIPFELGRRFPSAQRVDFRWYWLGMFCYSFGMQSRAVIAGWLIYQLTGSALSIGWYIGTWGLAAFFLSFFGGTLIDRLNLRLVLVVARGVAALALTILFLLVRADQLAFWHLLLFNLVNGAVAAFEYPARTAVVPKLVPGQELTGAFGLAYTAQNLAAIVGPALVGPIMDRVGAAPALLVTAAVMWSSALSILPIRPNLCDPVADSRRAPVLRGLLDGLRHILATPVLLGAEVLILLYALLMMPYRDILPAIAADVLRTGATGLGLLSSALSTGALLGTLFLSAAGEIRPRGLYFLGAALLESVLLSLFAISRVFALSLGLLALAGIGHGFFIPLSNTLLQAYAAPEMRGRVIGMNMFVWSLQPLGTIAIGAAADRIGPAWALLGSVVSAAAIYLSALVASQRMRTLP
mgnify:CR=1 FL=1